MSWAGCYVGRKVWWSTRRELSTYYTHTHTPLTAICISASVRPFSDQTHTHTPTHKKVRKWPVWLPKSWCVMRPLPIFLQKLRKEDAALHLFFLFFSPCLGDTQWLLWHILLFCISSQLSRWETTPLWEPWVVVVWSKCSAWQRSSFYR